MISLPSLLAAATYLSTNLSEGFQYRPQLLSRNELLLLRSEPNANDTMKVRRKKKNKYEAYSFTDKLEKDPFDALVDESLSKKKSFKNQDNIRQALSNNSVSSDIENPDVPRRITFPDNRDIDPYDPTTYGFVELGKIKGPHGVHGFMKIDAVTKFPERLCKPGIRHLKAPNRRSPRQIHLIEGKKISSTEYLIRLDGVVDRDAALKLKDFSLYSRQEERPQDIAIDEYLISDLVGMDVMLLQNFNSQETHLQAILMRTPKNIQKIGTISGVVLAEEMCSVPGLGNDLLEVLLLRNKLTEPSWRGKYVLVPFVPAIVPIVDLPSRTVFIDPPLGLLDLSYTHEENVTIKGFLPGSVEPS